MSQSLRKSGQFLLVETKCQIYVSLEVAIPSEVRSISTPHNTDCSDKFMSRNPFGSQVNFYKSRVH